MEVKLHLHPRSERGLIRPKYVDEATGKTVFQDPGGIRDEQEALTMCRDFERAIFRQHSGGRNPEDIDKREGIAPVLFWTAVIVLPAVAAVLARLL